MKRRPFAPIVLLISLMMTAATVYTAYLNVGNQRQEKFNDIVTAIQRVLTSTMEGYSNLLVQTGGLLTIEPNISVEQFRRYVEGIRMSDLYPGAQGLAFSKRVDSADLTHPSEKKESYPIVLVEPMDKRNTPAMGFDVSSEKRRRQAMELARDSGLPTLSQPVTLLHEISTTAHLGFLLFMPVYKYQYEPLSEQERRNNLIGFVFIPFNAQDLFRSVFAGIGETKTSVDIRITDLETSSTLFERQAAKSVGPYGQENVRMTFAGRVWNLAFVDRVPFDDFSVVGPAFLGLFGFIISILLYGIMRSSQRRSEAIEHNEDLLKKAEASQRFLSEASKILSISLDYKMTFKRIANMAVPRLCDACLIFYYEEDLTLHSVTHSRSQLEKMIFKANQEFETIVVQRTIQTQKSEIIPKMDDRILRALCSSEAHFKTLKALNIVSIICAPITVNGKVEGAIKLISSSREYTVEDLNFLEELAQRMARPIEINHLYCEIEEKVIQRTTEFKDSEQKYRSVMDSASDAIISCNQFSKVVSWNKGAERMFGFKANEVHGLNLSLMIRDRQRRALIEESALGIENTLKTMLGKTIELEGVKKCGDVFPIELSLSTWTQKGESFFTAIVRDVSERKKAEAEKAHLEQLERSNKELEQFAYVSSHDLQEPLRLVGSYAQLLQRKSEEFNDPTLQEYVKYIVDSVARMHELINDLLNYSRLGTPVINFQLVDLNKLVDDCLNSLRISIAESGVRINRGIFPRIVADPVQLTQLFTNLIANAVKFRGEKEPQITLAVEAVEDSWLFSVRDNGIGFKPEFSQVIFSIFKRLHGRDKYPGTGIGLAICKRVVERHGGKIWAESQPGQGTVFYFTLPQSLGSRQIDTNVV